MARNANTTWTILLSLSNGPTTRSCSNIFPEKTQILGRYYLPFISYIASFIAKSTQIEIQA